jgi:putative restriction endonuclease
MRSTTLSGFSKTPSPRLLPRKYSPIHPISGNGNQKAYLAEIDHAVFEFLISVAGFDAAALPTASGCDPILANIDDALEKEIINDAGLDTTTKQQIVLARQGQGIFRARIFEFERACRLTNVENPGLLIASHIKPWRMCNTAFERLDGANGLLLTPHVDRLFDPRSDQLWR